MKKPLNKVALALWIVAAVLALLNSVEIWSAYQNMKPLRQEVGEGYLAWEALVHSISSAIVQLAFLVGLGTLIEIADEVLSHVRKSD